VGGDSTGPGGRGRSGEWEEGRREGGKEGGREIEGKGKIDRWEGDKKKVGGDNKKTR
jgi:hypothetical protein